MELYGEQGFDRTTASEIAERAGLTERTFFRHFADKREVLFSGSEELQELLVSSVDGAPASRPPMNAIIAALDEAARVVFEDRHEYARTRQAIIAANPELRERELIKLASLAAALADALRRRGVTDPAASLAAEAGIGVFKVAFGRWTEGTGEWSLSGCIDECVSQLQLVTAAQNAQADPAGPGAPGLVTASGVFGHDGPDHHGDAE
jgi:AcrR family transcriptional regulator